MSKQVLIGLGAAVILLGAWFLFSQDSRPPDSPTPNDSTAVLAIYASKRAELPDHQLACIPETKSFCSADGCQTTTPSVFVLIAEDETGVTLYRCDEKPCDAYPAIAEISGAFMEIKTQENHGLLFKTSTLDQSYVEVVTLGTDALVSRGACFKNE